MPLIRISTSLQELCLIEHRWERHAYIRFVLNYYVTHLDFRDYHILLFSWYSGANT